MAGQDPPADAEPVAPGSRQPADDSLRTAVPWLGNDRPSARRPPAAGGAGHAEVTRRHRAPAAVRATPTSPSDPPPPGPAPAAGARLRLPADPRRLLILAGLLAVAVLVGGVGYLTAARHDGGSAVPAPTGAGLPALPPDVTPPAVPSAPPPGSAPPGTPEAPEPPEEKPAPPPRTRPTARPTAPPTTTAPPRRRAPKQIGPDDLRGFQRLLTRFCRKNGDLAAVLIHRRHRSAADATWFCLRVDALTRIDLDAACRDRFGGRAQARQLVRGDARTFRCFDA